MLVSEIAKKLNYDIVGDDCDVTGISFFDEASVLDIAVAFNKSEITKTSAKVALTHSIFLETDKTLLLCFDDIYSALVKVCEILIDAGIIMDYRLPLNLTKADGDFYIGKNVKIGEHAMIYPGVVIGDGVRIGDYCLVEPNVVVGSGVVLENEVRIGANSKIGESSFFHSYDRVDGFCHFDGCGIVRVGEKTRIGCNTIIQRGTISDTLIGASCMIGNGVDIGHDVKIGDHCKIVSQTGIAGNVSIKNNVVIFGQVGIANGVKIGKNVVVQAKSGVHHAIGDNQVVFGNYGLSFREEMEIFKKARNYFIKKGR